MQQIKQKTENVIPLENISSEFGEFLDLEGNKRVFLSGKFGVGKTFFLHDFFENNKDKYFIIHLHPVNYQISSNEDVIELLKYDILVSLVNENQDLFQKNDFFSLVEPGSPVFSFAKNNKSEIIRLFLSYIPKLGRPLVDTADLIKKFSEFYESLDEKKIVENYLKNVSLMKVEAPDLISNLIAEKVKEAAGERKSVLVLDDLDRIDPEHIFRTLNIFSAHFDSTDENKFKFDRVVLVGDRNNIKAVFHHRYGEDTHFKGYFDKFYTQSPYVFDNNKAVEEKVAEMIKQIKRGEKISDALGESGYIKLFLEDIFKRALRTNNLNLRDLYRAVNYEYLELRRKPLWNNVFYEGDRMREFLNLGIRLCISIFGEDEEFFVNVLNEIKGSIGSGEQRDARLSIMYSSSLLRAILDVKEDVEISYKEYRVRFGSNNNLELLEGGDATAVRLFYDVLIDYIGQSKHKQTQRIN